MAPVVVVWKDMTYIYIPFMFLGVAEVLFFINIRSSRSNKRLQKVHENDSDKPVLFAKICFAGINNFMKEVYSHSAWQAAQYSRVLYTDDGACKRLGVLSKSSLPIRLCK